MLWEARARCLKPEHAVDHWCRLPESTGMKGVLFIDDPVFCFSAMIEADSEAEATAKAYDVFRYLAHLWGLCWCSKTYDLLSNKKWRTSFSIQVERLPGETLETFLAGE